MISLRAHEMSPVAERLISRRLHLLGFLPTALAIGLLLVGWLSGCGREDDSAVPFHVDLSQQVKGLIAAPDGSAVLVVDDVFDTRWIGRRGTDGNDRWRTRVSDERNTYFDVETVGVTETLAIVHYIVQQKEPAFNGPRRGVVVAFDLRNGHERWRVSASADHGEKFLIRSHDRKWLAIAAEPSEQKLADVLNIESGERVRRLDASLLRNDKDFAAGSSMPSKEEYDLIWLKVTLPDGRETTIDGKGILGKYRDELVYWSTIELYAGGRDQQVLLFVSDSLRARVLPLLGDHMYPPSSTVEESLARRSHTLDRFVVAQGSDVANIIDLEGFVVAGTIPSKWSTVTSSGWLIVNTSNVLRVDHATGSIVSIQINHKDSNLPRSRGKTLEGTRLWVFREDDMPATPHLPVDVVDLTTMKSVFGVGLLGDPEVPNLEQSVAPPKTDGATSSAPHVP